MKKITNLLIVFAVLLGSVLLTSCGKIDKTYNTWYKYEGDINDLPIANAGEYEDPDDHQMKQGTGKIKDAKLYVKFNDVDGLTIRVISETKQTITFAGGVYEVPDVTVVFGGEKTYSTSEFGVIKWTALIRLGNFKQEEPPSTYTDISNLLQGQFNLKRVIYEFLGSVLGIK